MADQHEIRGLEIQSTRPIGGSVADPGALREDRPVVGGDLERLRARHQLNVSDMLYAFAMPPTRWYMYKTSLSQKPIKKVTIALLARYYDRHPDLLPRAKPSMTPNELWRVVGGPMKRLAVMMGNEAAASFRWLKTSGSRTSSMSPIAERLAYFLGEEARAGMASRTSFETAITRFLILSKADVVIQMIGESLGEDPDEMITALKALKKGTLSEPNREMIEIITSHLYWTLKEHREDARKAAKGRGNLPRGAAQRHDVVSAMEKAYAAARVADQMLMPWNRLSSLVREGNPNLQEWEAMVHTEARARGIEDIFSAGTWNPASEQKRRRGRGRNTSLTADVLDMQAAEAGKGPRKKAGKRQKGTAARSGTNKATAAKSVKKGEGPRKR